jgi:hypothetical protein
VLPAALQLTLTDENGISATVQQPFPAASRQPAHNPETARAQIQQQLSRLGTTLFIAIDASVVWTAPSFDPIVVPSSRLNALRREAVEILQSARANSFTRRPRALPIAPPAPYPHDSLSYLANVLNQAARNFYARHGVKVIAPAYEALEEPGEVSLMITKHCVRYSLSLCPKQAKGITGVQGTLKAEPLQLINGKERLTLRFDCKACEMHVVGKMKNSVVQQARLIFYPSHAGTSPASPHSRR